MLFEWECEAGENTAVFECYHAYAQPRQRGLEFDSVYSSRHISEFDF